jgi:hypothetical protein
VSTRVSVKWRQLDAHVSAQGDFEPGQTKLSIAGDTLMTNPFGPMAKLVGIVAWVLLHQTFIFATCNMNGGMRKVR